jgi:hypothetical protein
MLKPPRPTLSRLEGLLLKGQRLMEQRRGCHHCLNDLQAATLIVAMHKIGLEVNVATIDGCIERIKVAVETGHYPAHLLHIPEPLVGEPKLEARLPGSRLIT